MGRPKKGTGSAAPESTIDKVLSVGAQAKVKIYHTYLSRISRGEALKPLELKHYRQIESELEELSSAGSGKIIISMDDAAAYVGCSRKTISVNIKRGRLKQNADGTFSRPELDKFLARFGRRGSSAQSESVRDRQDKAELRYRLARARREEMLVEQMKGNLADWKTVKSEWSGRVQVVVAGLTSWVDRLPGLLVGKSRDEVRAILKAEIRTLQENYSRVGRYTPEVNE